MNASESDHPDLEVQSAFIEGKLDPDKAAEVIHHLSRCARCRLVVGRAAEIEEELEEEVASPPRRWSPDRRPVRRWRAPKIAVAVVIALAALALVWIAVDSLRPPGPGADPITRMASSAPVSIRTIKPRLSGGYR